MPACSQLLTVAVFGLCIGSFLNVCIYRLPLGESIVWPASRCTSCGRTLSWFDNVPVLSWVVLGGRCRTCKAPVSWMYPLVEAVTALVFVWRYLTVRADAAGLVRMLFACALIVLFVTDLQHKILPNTITLPGIVVGFVCSFFLPPGWVSSLSASSSAAESCTRSPKLLPAARAGRARHGRRQDAGDDWRVPRLEARAAHAGVGVACRFARSACLLIAIRPRQHEIRAAVRHLPRGWRVFAARGATPIADWYFGFYQ